MSISIHEMKRLKIYLLLFVKYVLRLKIWWNYYRLSTSCI